MEDEDGYMALDVRRNAHRQSGNNYQDTGLKTDQEPAKWNCRKIMLWVLLGTSLLLNVALMAVFIVFQLQNPSCPQNSACSCDWIPGCSKAYVTLDPNTANRRIDLSQDGKTASWGATENSYPDSPERFNSRVWVLGREGFLSNKHCWEVEVKGNGEWAVGVAKQSVQRKGLTNFTTEAGIWGIGEYWGLGHYVAFTTPNQDLPLKKKPRRIRVFLDYKYGQVEFFNAETKASIFLFNASSFGGEKIYPWLRVWNGSTLVLHP